MNRTSSPGVRHGLIALLACWCPATVLAADPVTADVPGVLHLANGGFLSGHLQDADSPETLLFQGSQFTAPFRFPVTAVRSLAYARPAEQPKPSGEFCFELSGGGVLYGDLRGVAEDTVDIDTAKFGRLSFKRERLHRFFRWAAGSELIYSGPTGLKGWVENGSESLWRDEGGRLVTHEPNASLTSEFPLPKQTLVEIELSWSQTPDFTLSLGENQKGDAVGRASPFRFHVVDGELAVMRETAREADIAPVTPVGSGEGRLHLLIYVDLQQGRILVYSMTGAPLAELNVAEAKPKIGAGVVLTNHKDTLRLERLRISRWNGAPPTPAAVDQPRFQSEDGAVADGRLSEFDADRQQVTFLSGDRKISVPLKTVDAVQLSSHVGAGAKHGERNVHVMYQDGTRIGGLLTRTGSAMIGIICPEIVQPVAAPVQGLSGITMLQAAPPATGGPPGKTMHLELADTKLRGRLVDGREQPGASCLAWQPESSETASPLRSGVNGKIASKSPPPAVKKPPRQTAGRAPGLRIFGGNRAQPAEPVAAPVKAASKDQKFLHLRSGDTIPCEVKSIDERGVTFETPMSTATFVAHQNVKAVELLKVTAMPRLSVQKRDRLLTLPRMQRDSPPLQLICSRNGDVLRGRILGLTESQLKVEVRLNERELARDRVAQIIWLHEDELKDVPSETDPPQDRRDPAAATRVQVQRSDGIRLTFLAEQFQDTTLSGRSDILGDCRTDLAQADQLLIGQSIEMAAANLPYHRWKLHHAVDPKFVQEESSEAAPGLDSPLVGKPAPDFRLDYLDGTKFHLKECQGQVVVLDFWATWCGPCLQVMPQIEQVVGEFQEHNVRLVAVNLEESPRQITATLQRHKIEVPVVLDQDGVVAHKYGATAIPQTVIIDRAGNVFRVFVGGGPDYADQLRDALKQVTSEARSEDSPASALEALP